LVMDNLTLSDTKTNSIKEIFFGDSSHRSDADIIQNNNVNISSITSNSTFDKTKDAWTSWVDIEITNNSENGWNAEYATTIDLPEGCWISDYYLFVGDKREPGILAEKKSAMWVFSQIRSGNRDPGILHYLTGNKVAFRVFPFLKDEVRKTGIEFLHKEPVRLTIDDHIVELGNQAEAMTENVDNPYVTYISSQRKQTLKAVKRTPYFHFLIDVSHGKKSHSADFIQRIEKILETYDPLSENAQISFVNSYVNTLPLTSDWKQNYQSQPFEGGFYLDRAIRTTLFNAYKNKSNPVIVVVTTDIQDAVLDNDFSDFEFSFPERDRFFNLSSDGSLQPHSLTENPKKQINDSISFSYDQTVLEYRLADNSTVYLPDNDKPGIILKEDIFEVQEAEIKEKNWQTALTLQGLWRSQILHPETSDNTWLRMVKYSFMSKVMTPVTSYLVVENEAQKAILKKKQEQVLSGNRSLDLDENTQRMSEPGFVVFAILLGMILWYRHKRQRGLT
jgi:hypothetical protein